MDISCVWAGVSFLMRLVKVNVKGPHPMHAKWQSSTATKISTNAGSKGPPRAFSSETWCVIPSVNKPLAELTWSSSDKFFLPDYLGASVECSSEFIALQLSSKWFRNLAKANVVKSLEQPWVVCAISVNSKTNENPWRKFGIRAILSDVKKSRDNGSWFFDLSGRKKNNADQKRSDNEWGRVEVNVNHIPEQSLVFISKSTRTVVWQFISSLFIQNASDHEEHCLTLPNGKVHRFHFFLRILHYKVEDETPQLHQFSAHGVPNFEVCPI